MSQQEASDSRLSKWLESNAPPDDDLEIVRLSAARTRAIDEAGAADLVRTALRHPGAV